MKKTLLIALLAIGFASNAQSNDTPNMSDTLLANFFNLGNEDGLTETLQDIIQNRTSFYDCTIPNERHVFDIVGYEEQLIILFTALSESVEDTEVSNWNGWDNVEIYYFEDNSYLAVTYKEESETLSCILAIRED